MLQELIYSIFIFIFRIIFGRTCYGTTVLSHVHERVLYFIEIGRVLRYCWGKESSFFSI